MKLGIRLRAGATEWPEAGGGFWQRKSFCEKKTFGDVNLIHDPPGNVSDNVFGDKELAEWKFLFWLVATQTFLEFSPRMLGEMIPIDKYFSNGLETTN